MDEHPSLEIRLWLAEKLRPNGGYEAYFYGDDTEFCDRIDRDWKMHYHIFDREFLKRKAVTVTNL